jgi:uncharacterized protein (DUF1330 family)
MSAYVVAHLREINPHPEILEYQEKIQPTLDAFSGRFIVHGGALEIREGAWPGNLVIIEFPNIEKARAWYESPAYQKLLPLRTRHIVADAILVKGVEPDDDSARMAADLRAANSVQTA